MAKLVECVPNFSEGRNKEVIDAIADAISQTEGCLLLDVDAGPSTNRTVYTFVGSPNAVIQGALCAARIAFQLIDMTKHKGEHPRMGALDVCPFIPVKDVSMEECVFCARRFGQQLASELEVPVYLYAEAAQQENRKSLPAIRLGQYEALPEKLKTEEWMPDFGPATFVPRWGATVSGARKFLIAYNVNLLSTKELAHRIALDIREQGRGKDQPGCLKKVQAISWYLDEKNLAQVSANLLDFETTGLHGVYEEVCKEAKALNLPVVGSQLVGLVPLMAMLQTADFYMQKENLFILEEEHKLRLVISRLGLDSLGPFNPKERIVEYIVQKTITEGSLVTQPLFEFVQNVGSRSATPGGGSVSAAVAAMGSALGCMVGLMTYGKRQFEFLDGTMRQLILPFHNAMTDLLTLVDADSNAFNNYMVTTKLSRATTEEKIRREVAVQEGLKNAIGIPLSVAEKVNVLWPTLKEMGKHGNIVCKSDLQVAAKALETAVFGAYFNVLINLKDVKDDEFKAQTHEKISGLLDKAKAGAELVLEVLEKRTE
ncbi:formimidoyltransferase-cyclodeaminase isoform X2 [Microcaecilia unicolor]|nr:formimidoyltransferase-cyclodeaminase isoform X2 [Microcaecilia unicolor]XP_030066461.1 formimidoyltransferase-cyclodeaminase isoform X2 [Microcaecilia unicolor]XP_030066462.1 formimidoyltransferase-cyclodeaminase isoform X2 [Microcaecilia unicolor]XP_030066463.1 formimidoyltransferase-cyclodeaminase isoform X2 [Microcaecilia unicolor]